MKKMPKPEKYANPDARKAAWIQLHSSPAFAEFFLQWWLTDKIERLERHIIDSSTPETLTADRARLHALREVQNGASPENFTLTK